MTADELIRVALKEDIGFGDVTSEAICGENDITEGILWAKEDLVVAGGDIFAKVFAVLDSRVSINFFFRDGDKVNKNTKIAVVHGPTRALLAGERVALNFLQHLSGIATQTSFYVNAVGSYPVTIVDTRKTIPGMRLLEKYAVKVGGGKNHRHGLADLILIKDNHIKVAGGVVAAVNKVRQSNSPYLKIEVEVETLAQVHEAMDAGVDIIMLDNMELDAIKNAVIEIDGRALVEVSGNVTLARVSQLAATGVDIISSGALTHSVVAADISLRLI
ncbi:MAG: nadC [Firmicutes bacterium]|nr:nadC [Bacillota bacterium]